MEAQLSNEQSEDIRHRIDQIFRKFSELPASAQAVQDAVFAETSRVIEEYQTAVNARSKGDFAAQKQPEALFQELLLENQRQTALLDAIFSADPGGLAVVVGERMEFAYANPAYRFLCPHNGADLIGQPYGAIWNAADPNCYAEPIREVVASGRPFQTLGFERQFPDGDRRIFTLQVRRMDWNDRPAALIALWDTTEQHLAEQQRMQIETQLTDFMETTHDAFFTLDCDWRIGYANRRYGQISGKDAHKLFGLNFWEVFPRYLGTPVEQHYRKAMAERAPVAFESAGFYSDSWYEVSIYPTQAGLSVFVTDRTEEKQAERRLRESEDRYRTTLASIGDAVITTDPVGTVTYLNPVAEQLTGWSSRDAAGQPLGQVFPIINEKTQQPAQDPVGKVLRQGGIIALANHTALIARDGRMIPIEDSAAPIQNAAGETQGVVMVFHDVTEKRKADQALLQSELRYRSLYEASLDGCELTQPDGTILSANPQACRMFGMTEAEICQAGRGGVVVPTPALIEFMQERERTGRARAELTLRRKDGTTFAAECLSVVFTDADGSIKTSLTFRDISERKQAETTLRESEEKYRNLIRYAPVGIYEVDFRNKRYTSVNDVMCELTGYTREELLEMNPFDILDDEGKKTFRARIQAWLSGERPAENVFYRVKAKDGHEIVAELHVTFKADENGQPVGATVIGYDITERKQMEAALHALNAQLEQRVSEQTAALRESDMRYRSQLEEQVIERTAALRESEERLHLLTDNLPESAVYQYIHEADNRVRFVYLSAGIEILNGVRVEDVLRDASVLQSQFSAEDFQRLVEAEASSASHLSDFELEAPMRRPDGEVRWMRLRSRPRRLPDGLTIWDGVQTDITDRKQTEQALRENEERFRSVWEVTQDGLALSDANATVFAVNPAYCEIYGYPLKQILGHNFAIIFPPELRAWANEQYQVTFHQPEVPARIEAVVQRSDGTRRIVESRVEFITQDGRRQAMLSIIRDITEMKRAEQALRESEERYRKLVETSLAGIYVLQDGIYVYANPVGLGLLGIDTVEQLSQTPAIEFIAPEYRQLIHSRIERGDQGESNLPIEIEVIGVDGSRRRMETRSAPIQYNGRPAVFIQSEDVTARKQSESETRANAVQIEIQRRLLEQREQERLQIARDLHDGPVQEVMGAMYALQEAMPDCDDHLLREKLEAVYDSLKAQIGELRDYASDLRPPTLAKFGFEKALRSHLEGFQEKHPEIQAQFEAHQEGNLIPEPIRLALFRIYQQAMNNVVKHAHASQVRILLSKTGERVSLEIQDNGTGFEIPQDWLELARCGHLGLVGMRERAEAIGGTIEICSQPNRGTQIQVIVPLQE